MFASVRQLKIKKNFKDENQRRVHDELLPKLRAIPGFIDYYLIYTDKDEEVSIGFFADKNGADAMNRLANEFVKNIASHVHLDHITEGDVVVESRAPTPA